MSLKSNTTLQVSHSFNFPAERVFDAWLDPQQIPNFLFTTSASEVVVCDIEARVGGSFKIVDRRSDQDIEHVGEYLEIDRPRRLVFTFAVPQFSKQFTRVTIDIERREGGCDLTLTHEDVLPDYLERSTEGWTMILNALDKSLG